MIVRALVTKGDYVQGVEYDLPDAIGQALIIQGTVSFVAIAPAHNREKAIPQKWDTRTGQHTR
jgi:hypothetical protein